MKHFTCFIPFPYDHALTETRPTDSSASARIAILPDIDSDAEKRMNRALKLAIDEKVS